MKLLTGCATDPCPNSGDEAEDQKFCHIHAPRHTRKTRNGYDSPNDYGHLPSPAVHYGCCDDTSEECTGLERSV